LLFVFLERIFSSGSFIKLSLIKIFIIQLCLIDEIQIFFWKGVIDEIEILNDEDCSRKFSSEMTVPCRGGTNHLHGNFTQGDLVKIPPFNNKISSGWVSTTENLHMRGFVLVLWRRGKIRVSSFPFIWWENHGICGELN